MTDAIQKAKLKSPYVDRLNPRYAGNTGAPPSPFTECDVLEIRLDGK
jgi:hypothetical protein